MSRSVPKGRIRVYVCARCMMGGGTLKRVKNSNVYEHGSGTGCKSKSTPPMQIRGH